MSDFNTLELLSDPRGFATLWLSREEKNNAFNAEMIRELIIALDKVASDATLRFLIVRAVASISAPAPTLPGCSNRPNSITPPTSTTPGNWRS